MKLRDYLINKENKIEKMILKDCKPFLKEMKGGELLWRGSKKTICDIEKFIPRKDRKPLDTPMEIHKFLDELFLKYHGWRARSEGVFADIMERTFLYGNSYLFFPIGNYKYLWSESVTDLTSELIAIIGLYDKSLKNPLIPEEERDIEKSIKEKYINKGLKQASLRKYGGEIIFKCKGYYLVNQKYYDELLKLI